MCSVVQVTSDLMRKEVLRFQWEVDARRLASFLSVDFSQNNLMMRKSGSWSGRRLAPADLNCSEGITGRWLTRYVCCFGMML